MQWKNKLLCLPVTRKVLNQRLGALQSDGFLFRPIDTFLMKVCRFGATIRDDCLHRSRSRQTPRMHPVLVGAFWAISRQENSSPPFQGTEVPRVQGETKF